MGQKKSFNGINLEGQERKCPECQSTDVDYIKGELICKNCGLVIE